MPLSFGPFGLVVKTLSEIVTDIGTRLKAAPSLGPNIRLEAGGKLFDIVSVFSRQVVSIHEALLGLFNAFNRNLAEGANLDNLGNNVGVPRLPATRSTVLQTIVGTPGTLIVRNSQVRVPSGPIFRTTVEVSIPGGGTIDVIVESNDTGPVTAAAGAITEIVDGVVGWTSTTNTLKATPGRDLESDIDYRARIGRSLQTGETATDQAIRTKVEQVSNVLQVLSKSNREFPTDADGTEGKASRTIVHPSTVDETEVALAIWETIPSGIKPFGTDHTVLFVDDQGYNQSVSFDDATVVPLFLEIEITKDADLYPLDGDDQVLAKVDELGLTLKINEDFLPLELECLVALITGVREANVKVGLAVSPTQETPFIIAIDELAELDSTAPRTVIV